MITRYTGAHKPCLRAALIALLLIAGCDAGPLQETPPDAALPQDPAWSADTFGIFDISNDPRVFEAMHTLGVGWVRLQFRMGEADLRALTQRTETLFAEGFRLWLTLYHRDRANITDQAGFDQSERGAYPPAEAEAYRHLLAETLTPLVEQLRAQGKQPGAWLVVQLANEVAPADVFPPDRPMRFWHGTAEEYLATLRLTYEAVKAVDPLVPVAAAGISSAMMERVLAGEPEALAWNERLLGEGRYDWADVHLRHRAEDVAAKVAWVRARHDGPVAATEIGGFCDGEGTCTTSTAYAGAVQAEDLEAKMAAALEAGLVRVFWASLVENPAVAPHFQQESLITIDWQKKPAFFAYEALIAERTKRD